MTNAASNDKGAWLCTHTVFSLWRGEERHATVVLPSNQSPIDLPCILSLVLFTRASSTPLSPTSSALSGISKQYCLSDVKPLTRTAPSAVQITITAPGQHNGQRGRVDEAPILLAIR